MVIPFIRRVEVLKKMIIKNGIVPTVQRVSTGLIEAIMTIEKATIKTAS